MKQVETTWAGVRYPDYTTVIRMFITEPDTRLSVVNLLSNWKSVPLITWVSRFLTSPSLCLPRKTSLS